VRGAVSNDRPYRDSPFFIFGGQPLYPPVQAPHEKKTGARYRKITACARRGKGKRRKFFFTANVCAS
jgi:hypothetical protein